MSCFKKNEKVFLSEELELCRKLKQGGKGDVNTCRLKSYRGNKQLICKIENEVRSLQLLYHLYDH